MSKILPIDDPSDVRLACYANLRWNANPRPDSDWFIVEGRMCVRRLIDSPIEVLSILVERGKEAEVASWLDGDSPIYSLPTERIRDLVGYDFHRGILACGRRPDLRPINSLQLQAANPRLALAAIGVVERENLGSMLRTAAALGVEHVLLGPRTADPFSRRTVRVSMGAVLTQKLYTLVDPVEALDRLQQTAGVRTVVTTLSPAATPLNEFVPDERACILVLGSEADGIDREIEEIATDRVTIPMRLGTDSLNVSVAAAIFLYELIARHQ